MSRCWRLTCPTNGARQSFEVARLGDNHPNYEKMRRALAMLAENAKRRHPATWGEPPEPEFML